MHDVFIIELLSVKCFFLRLIKIYPRRVYTKSSSKTENNRGEFTYTTQVKLKMIFEPGEFRYYRESIYYSSNLEELTNTPTSIILPKQSLFSRNNDVIVSTYEIIIRIIGYTRTGILQVGGTKLFLCRFFM